jgi:hypothetical protein
MTDSWATLRIHRRWGHGGLARRIRVFVDDALVGRVWERRSIEVQLPPGRLTVSARFDWARGEVEVDLVAGRTTQVDCQLAFVGGRSAALRWLRVFPAVVVAEVRPSVADGRPGDPSLTDRPAGT